MVIRRTIILAFLLISINLFSQHKAFQFGFKAGANLGWMSSSEEDIYKNNGVNGGGNWGVIADFFLMENYSLTTGFNVLYLNGTLEYPDIYTPENSNKQIDGTMQREYRTNYMEIPVIFTMKTHEINKLRYYGQIGVSVAFLLSADGKDKFIPISGGESVSDKKNIYDDMRFTREAFIVGAGVEIPLSGSTYIRTGIVYNNALFNVLKGNNALYTSTKNNGRNNFIGIEVNILF